MARHRYSIPASLNRSLLDYEPNLSGKNIRLKAIPLKVVLFYLISVLVIMWMLTSTPLKGASPVLLTFIVIWWVMATIYFGAYSKTKEMRFMQLMPLLEYLPASARRVLTRSDSKPGPFHSIVGIVDVNETSGLISYTDGSVGQAYMVVGSASRLLFDQDRDAILDRNDRFYRKIDPGVEWIFLTNKQPQRVHSQIASLERRNRKLDREARDPDLVALMDENLRALQTYVGESFSSIHQFLIIKAGNIEALRAAHNLLDAEASDSSLVFKQAVMLTRDEVLDLLRMVYGPVAVSRR